MMFGMLATVGLAAGAGYMAIEEGFNGGRREAMRTAENAQMVAALERQLRAQRERYEARIKQIEKQVADLKKIIDEMK